MSLGRPCWQATHPSWPISAPREPDFGRGRGFIGESGGFSKSAWWLKSWATWSYTKWQHLKKQSVCCFWMPLTCQVSSGSFFRGATLRTFWIFFWAMWEVCHLTILNARVFGLNSDSTCLHVASTKTRIHRIKNKNKKTCIQKKHMKTTKSIKGVVHPRFLDPTMPWIAIQQDVEHGPLPRLHIENMPAKRQWYKTK